MNRYERYLADCPTPPRGIGTKLLLKDVRDGEWFKYDREHHPHAVQGTFRICRRPTHPEGKYQLQYGTVDFGDFGDSHVVLV